MLVFAFRTLNLNRVELNTFDFNRRAQKCYLKVGFKEVGRRRKARFIDGEYHDDIIMDVLKDEWLARSKERKFGDWLKRGEYELSEFHAEGN